jgi:hypothetical protein
MGTRATNQVEPKIKDKHKLLGSAENTIQNAVNAIFATINYIKVNIYESHSKDF